MRSNILPIVLLLGGLYFLLRKQKRKNTSNNIQAGTIQIEPVFKPSYVQQPKQNSKPSLKPDKYVEHEVLVKLNIPLSSLKIMELGSNRYITLGSYTFEVKHIYKTLSKGGKTYLLLYNPMMTTQQIIKALRQIPVVESVSPNWLVSIQPVKPIQQAPIVVGGGGTGAR